ncbi:MAG: hypothetical protein E7463_04140 [Ruminococcaceae bacterium]|nr:hypothetical protein [Oscillospiraceae bacterium]
MIAEAVLNVWKGVHDMETMLNLIPRPAKMTVYGGQIRLSRFDKLQYSGIDAQALAFLAEQVPELSMKAAGEGFCITMGNGAALTPAGVPAKPDAYVLRTACDGVRIDANDEAGLFYGLQTLRQLPDECPALCITDWAAIPIRMMHWDLKGYLPRFETLKAELERLAAYKVNAILLELEDKYAFRCAPDIAVKGAYTYEQLRELSILAKSLHIAIVPKLQCIAHVDYILKHERYRHLRENGHIFQFCPVNEDVQTLWAAMCDELMEVFAEHGPYFHIGADEPGNLGECPECQKLGAADSYLWKVSRCIEHVSNRGWTPVMWDDIVRNHYGLFSKEEERVLRAEVGKRAVLMYWAYGYGGAGNEFPYIDEYREAGLRIWGASGYSGCDNWAGSVPPLAVRGLNCDAWAKAAAEYGIECVCATGWTRIGSADCPAEPQESSWMTILYAAATMWNAEADDYSAFIKNLFLQLYGKQPDEKLTASLLNIKASPYDYKQALNAQDEPDELRFLRCAAAAESLVTQRDRLNNYFQYYQGKLGFKLEDYRLALLTRITDGLRCDIAELRRVLREVFSIYYEDVTVEEILRTRLDWLEALNNQMIALLEKTEAM